MSQTDLVQAMYPDLPHEAAEKKKPDISKLENGRIPNPQSGTVQRIAEILMISDAEIDELRKNAATPADKLRDIAALSRKELEDLAARFEIEGRYEMPIEALRKELENRADDYRAYRRQIDKIDEVALRAHNLKARAEVAAEQLDFDEVETVLAEVDAIETMQAYETKIARAQNALLRNRVERAFQILSAAADSLGSLSDTAPARARIETEDILYQHGLRYGGEGMALSEAMLRQALDSLNPESQPVDWARAQNALAIALQQQGTRTEGARGADLLAQAVAAYDAALEVRTRQDHPVDWAATQNNKGAALRNQGTRTESPRGSELLAQAVAAYDAALEVRTRQDHPVAWATTQNNRGTALLDQGTRTEGARGAELLAKAVAAYDAALEVFTRQDHQVDLASSKILKGIALHNQGTRTEGARGSELLAQAVAAYDAALEVRTRQDHPMDGDHTQKNQSTSLQYQGTRIEGARG
ncbi:MAG: hypothetical protein AAF672_16775, partial [Pseudomonadota bacterium]